MDPISTAVIDLGPGPVSPVCLYIACRNHNIGLRGFSCTGSSEHVCFLYVVYALLVKGLTPRSLLIFHVDCVESRSSLFYWCHMLSRAFSSPQP